jgi:hypothetical protein
MPASVLRSDGGELSKVFETPADSRQTGAGHGLNKEGYEGGWKFSVSRASTVFNLEVAVKNKEDATRKTKNCAKQNCLIFLVIRSLQDTSI